MIRIQDLAHPASVLRGYAEDDPAPMADFVISCILEWESREVVWVHALHGVGKRQLWRKFVAALDARGATTIRARRADGRRLPRATQLADGTYVMYIADLQAQPPDTGFAELL